jgi:hypothetical protein
MTPDTGRALTFGSIKADSGPWCCTGCEKACHNTQSNLSVCHSYPTQNPTLKCIESNGCREPWSQKASSQKQQPNYEREPSPLVASLQAQDQLSRDMAERPGWPVLKSWDPAVCPCVALPSQWPTPAGHGFQLLPLSPQCTYNTTFPVLTRDPSQ